MNLFACKSKRLIALAMAVVCSSSLFACGKKVELTDDEINSFEHSTFFSLKEEQTESQTQTIDEFGYVLCDDYVFVAGDNTYLFDNDKSAGDQNAVMISYGEKLYRTGYNESGYTRVFYDGKVCYVLSDSLTEYTIDSTSDFSYSVGALDIVATDRQYYSYDDMVRDLNDIREQFSDIVTLNAVGESADFRTIYEIVIGNTEAKNNILVVGGEEGCEYMTSLFAAKLAEYYAHYSNEGKYNGYLYSELLSNCAIHIVPMLNPDGVSISQFGEDACGNQSIIDNINAWFERDQTNGGTSLSKDNYLMFYYANSNGVDINYNFDYSFDEAGLVSSAANKGFKGDAVGSENEVRAITQLINRVKPNLVINLRTTGNKISYDFSISDEMTNTSKGFASVLASAMAYEIDEHKYGAGYYGTLEGYCAGKLGIPSVTLRIGSGDAPLSLNEYSSIWASGRESMAAIMLYLGKGAK